MPHDAFIPCRAWLGLEPEDLEVPHRLLGIAAGEPDPLAIVRAADRRITIVRAAAPEFAADRDALIAQIEAARDTLLTAAVAARGAAAHQASTPPPEALSAAWMSAPPVPPPVPPAVPPRVPPAELTAAPTVPPPAAPPPAVPPPPTSPPFVSSPAVTDDATECVDEEQIRVVRRPRIHRRARTDPVGMALTVAAIAASAVAIVGIVVLVEPAMFDKAATTTAAARKPEDARGTGSPKPRDGSDASAGRTPRDDAPVGGGPAPPITPPVRPASPPPTQRPPVESSPPVDEPPSVPTPPPVTPPPQDAPPPVDVEAIRRQVAAAAARAFAAVRAGDVATAKRELEAVGQAALDDQQATDRLDRWRTLVLYAERYPDLVADALTSAEQGRDFSYRGRTVSVYPGEKPGDLVMKDRGAISRFTRDTCPAELTLAIVTHWCAGENLPANSLYLGIGALLLPTPDLDRARSEWRAAASAGLPDGRRLLDLLDDPVVHGE